MHDRRRNREWAETNMRSGTGPYRGSNELAEPPEPANPGRQRMSDSLPSSPQAPRFTRSKLNGSIAHMPSHWPDFLGSLNCRTSCS